MMQTVPLTLTTPAGSYTIHVGPGLLDHLPEHLGALGVRGALWLISDSNVSPRYGAPVEGRLRAAGYRVSSSNVPAGEASKDLAVVAHLYDWLIGSGVERRDLVLALGGGVVGDLVGFVAATVLRGIGLVQLPTTLQAMVDSAIGGKTGVNHSLGKNLIGAFYQPQVVLSDTATLATLPARELRSGWAEVIKHGVIRDAGLFEELEQVGFDQAFQRPASNIQHLIERAARVKVDIVSADERETGERMLLNYGHTLGHAIEAAAADWALLHGEAVAIGMHLEAQIAQRLGLVDEAMVARQEALLHTCGLPTTIPAGITVDQILELTLRDKKVRAGRVRWALPTSIGTAAVRDDVPEALVRAVLGEG